MIQGDGGNVKWARVQTVEGGPVTDYTTLGQCQGMNTLNTKAGFKPTMFCFHFLFLTTELLVTKLHKLELTELSCSPAHCELSLVQNPHNITSNYYY